MAGGPTKQPALGRFLLPVAECTFALEQVLEDLQKDPWPCQPDERVQRCTGTALTVALGLLESSVPRQGSRIMMFIAGPPTIGIYIYMYIYVYIYMYIYIYIHIYLYIYICT
jgi:protein transport protein SEC23